LFPQSHTKIKERKYGKKCNILYILLTDNS